MLWGFGAGSFSCSVGAHFAGIREKYLRLAEESADLPGGAIDPALFLPQTVSRLKRRVADQSPSSIVSPFKTPTKSVDHSQKTPLAAMVSQIKALTSPFQKSPFVLHGTPPENSHSLPFESNVSSVTRAIHHASPVASAGKTNSPLDQRLKSAAERKLEREKERLEQIQKTEAERSARMERAIAQKKRIEEEQRAKKHEHYQKVLSKGKEEALASKQCPGTPQVLPEVLSE